MKQGKREIDLYALLYKIYMILSLISMFTTIILFIIYYFTGFKAQVTVSHLFLLAILLLTCFYFRLNALHYHRILVSMGYRVIPKEWLKKLGKVVFNEK